MWKVLIAMTRKSNLDSDRNDNDDVYYNLQKILAMAKTYVFGSSFCSFVHNFPRDMIRRKGEKFTYLVVQNVLVFH